MKKIMTFLGLILCVVSAQAQIKDAGVKVGVDVTNFTSKNAPEFLLENTFGYEGGLFVDVRLAENSPFTFLGELLYNYKIDGDSEAVFARIPMLFTYQVVDNFTVQAGPTIEINGFEETAERHERQDLRGIGASATVGVAYDLTDLLVDGMSVTARYNHGLGNWARIEDRDIRASSFQVSLGYSFMKKNK
ncbi:MAG: hypothetical protein C4K58_08035 [Flavobacteriaceae bacterium]|nr:MAG: hypothetical protein C4K58_08035 [Flavobacteriaceae bacterium]